MAAVRRPLAPELVIYLMVITLVAVVLYPYFAVTVPSGHVGVLWKRFGGGTGARSAPAEGLGLHLICLGTNCSFMT